MMAWRESKRLAPTAAAREVMLHGASRLMTVLVFAGLVAGCATQSR